MLAHDDNGSFGDNPDSSSDERPRAPSGDEFPQHPRSVDQSELETILHIIDERREFLYLREPLFGGGCTIEDIQTFGRSTVFKIIHDKDGYGYEGTGFWFAKSSWIFTCRHVLRDRYRPKRSLADILKYARFEFLIDGYIVTLKGNDLIVDSSFKSTDKDVDFGAIKLTPKAASALNRRQHTPYNDRECPLTFSLLAKPRSNKFEKGRFVEFCFFGYPLGRPARAGPQFVRGKRPIHSSSLDSDGNPCSISLHGIWVREGFSGGPVWFRLGTNKSGRWTLAGILINGTDDPPIIFGDVHLKIFERDPPVADGEKVFVGFALKDGMGFVNTMLKYRNL